MGIPPGIIADLSAGFAESEILARWTGRVVDLKFRGLLHASDFYPAQFLQITEIDDERMETARNRFIWETRQIFISQFFDVVGIYIPTFFSSDSLLKPSSPV